MGNIAEDIRFTKALMLIGAMNDLYIEEFEHIARSIFNKHKTKKILKELTPEIKKFNEHFYNVILLHKDREFETNLQGEFNNISEVIVLMMEFCKGADLQSVIELGDILKHYKEDVRVVTDARLFEICEEFRKYGKLGLTQEQAIENYKKNNNG